MISVLNAGSSKQSLSQMSPMTIAKQIGSKIREFRRAREMTQAQLAEFSMRTVDGISQIERGVNTPSLETLLAICSSLGVGLSDLIEVDSVSDNRSKRSALVAEANSMLNTMSEAELAVAVDLMRVVKQRMSR
ncbi:helix-turn-helix domain-containing protein [Agrobacterium larrymoorei]|uniref:Helix-turn-helix transcriptional regulator n=2 Tax=Agrobacterium larrymoorei TaxID=160699 RepID=A0A4D7DT84_9HYPH|nr:helix-turn-helix transcriptional regulator [Agrobacterium larrymoorei]QYA09486.1 helix-turn-helix transcriptional regulator [Agrobacterium larrymoorei]